MTTGNFMSEDELKAVHSLVEHLNTTDVADTNIVSVHHVVYDINGERLGEVAFNRNTNSYTFYIGDTDDI